MITHAIGGKSCKPGHAFITLQVESTDVRAHYEDEEAVVAYRALQPRLDRGVTLRTDIL